MAETKILASNDDAQTARLRFKFRGLNNALLVVAIFTVTAFVVTPTPYATMIEISVGGALFYLYFFVLEKRGIGFHCSNCGKYITSNTPWVCGFEQCRNLNVINHPFLECCAICTAEPKAYECHHCGKIVFLSADRLAANAARCLNLPAAEPNAAKDKEWEEEKQNKERDIARAELDEKLKKIKDNAAGLKMKSPKEKAADKFDQSYEASMGPREHARKKLAEVEELYKNDPALLADAKKAINDALNDLI